MNMNTNENGNNEDHGNPSPSLEKDLRVMSVFSSDMAPMWSSF
jgi:hypothetical protein